MKRIIIIGASSGIGKEIAETFERFRCKNKQKRYSKNAKEYFDMRRVRKSVHKNKKLAQIKK